jgi:hypothetical protein
MYILCVVYSLLNFHSDVQPSLVLPRPALLQADWLSKIHDSADSTIHDTVQICYEDNGPVCIDDVDAPKYVAFGSGQFLFGRTETIKAIWVI